LATQAQYDFFKDLYEEENARAQSLIDRGKIYLSIVSLFFGGVFLKLDWAIDHRNEIERGFGFYVIGTASFLIALVLVCLALQVLSYEALTDPEELIVQISGEQAADAEFRAARIADYTVASMRNSHQNDRRAVYLQVSLALIIVGTVLFCTGMALILI